MMDGQRSSFATLLKERKVLVLLGAGGVGKTTTSIAVAFAGAAMGKRVALLSIDPAKRLAAALGLSLGDTLRPINLPRELNAEGSVDAAMLDQKAVFDNLVRRHSPSEETAAKILANPTYIAASTSLIGPLEYLALAKLADLAADPRYDLVVLDTPPDTHALDFLARPNVLAGFSDSKVMNWLIKPFALAGKLGFGRMMSFGEKLMGGVAKVTGTAALAKFADFLILLQDVIDGFQRSGEQVVSLLKQESTGFVLVSTATTNAARSASTLAVALRDLGYVLDLVIANRCLPESLSACLAASTDQADSPLPRHDAEALARRVAMEDIAAERLARVLSEGRQAFGPRTPCLRVPELAFSEGADAGVPELVKLAELMLRSNF